MKVGDRVQDRGGDFATVVTREAAEVGYGSSLPNNFTPIRWDDHNFGIDGWGASNSVSLLNPPRVPLKSVKTAEEAEAWVGEEVEFIEAGEENPGWYVEGKGRLLCWEPRPGRSSGVWYITGDTPQSVHRSAEFIRPLTQEPVAITPGEGKPAKREVPRLTIKIPNKRGVSSHCPTCRADLREEAHASDCCNPNAVLMRATEDILARNAIHDANLKAIRRREWIDELESLPYISPQELARIGRRR